MPRGVKKVLELQKVRTLEARASRNDAAKRIKGDAPALGLIVAKKKKPAKPSLKKVNSKGEVVKTKAKPHPAYKVLIKRCLKEDQSRKGTSRQAIEKYITTNYGEVNKNALRRALEKGLAEKRLVKKGLQRWGLSKSEKKDRKKKKKSSKKKKSTKSAADKKGKKPEKKKSVKKVTKKGDKKVAKEKIPKKAKVPKKGDKTKAPVVSKAPKVGRGVPKAAPKAAPKRGSSSGNVASTSSSSGDNVWVWQYFDKGFQNYDAEASDIVEGVYQEYLTSPYTCDVRSVKSGQWQYEIDFRVMTQTNIQHENHTKRRIRRLQVPSSEKGNKQKNYGGDEMYEHVPEKNKK